MARIVMIDDDEDILSVYKEILTHHDYEVLTASDPATGLELVKTKNPDLVILDIMMPSGYEGFDVARTIREEFKMIKLPIIVMSSIHEKKQIPYRFAPDETYLPIDLWLDKPIDPDVLVNIIQETLGDLPQISG